MKKLPQIIFFPTLPSSTVECEIRYVKRQRSLLRLIKFQTTF